MVLDKEKTIHFIGIGGISMSSLAEILLDRGYSVSGSDSKESALTDHLKSLGAEIFIGQSPDNISDKIGLVVYTAAISEKNPELMKVREMGITAVTRAVFLGRLMQDYGNVICISGTHGKTTTTSLISQVFLDNDMDPTILSGGIMPAIGGNTRIGRSQHMIAESCEYTNSFLSFFPKIAVILNVKADHLDFFKDLDDIRASFLKFAKLIPEDGTLVINGEIENLNYFTDPLKCNIVTYGLNGNFDYTADNITYDDFACGSFDLIKKGQNRGRVHLNITGEHNVSNAVAAAAVADICGVDLAKVCEYLGHFEGVDRRFQRKGQVNGFTIIDDYAHHPDEIAATLSAAMKYPHKKLWVVFQPHTYTRTLALMDDFAAALSKADAVVLPDIYPAREEDIYGISSEDLQKKIAANGCESYYIPTFEEVEKFILKNVSEGDVLITMGAGDVVNIGNSLLKK